MYGRMHDRSGVPGVWFYSLDANQWLAVKIARRFVSRGVEVSVFALERV